MKKESFIIAFLIFTIMSLTVVQVVVSNRLSTDGIAFEKIEEEIRHYKAENSMLLERVLAASSLKNIATKAATLGFVDDKSQLVIKTSLPLAAKRP